ncbi:MAG: biopolymer transporter ExbD [Elusimicrobiota bacterium]
MRKSLRSHRAVRAAPITEPNLTPICDAAMVLLIVFIITMPAVFWSGIKINATRAVADNSSPPPVAAEPKEPQIVSLSVTKGGFYLNGELTALADLVEKIRMKLANLEEKTVIILPDGDVSVQQVVEAFDSAKLAGALKLALLKKA